jgi:hypothetical protein
MDINNFRLFNSEVWGNVSDYVMVLVTTATGLLILFTFQSQQELQRLQNEIYRLSIRPEIVIIANPFLINSGDDSYPFDVRIENADVFNLRIEIIRAAVGFNITWLESFLHPVNLQKGTLQQTQYSYSGSHVLTDNNFDPNLISIRITFRDALNNSYVKDFRMNYHMPLANEPAVLVRS